MYQILIQVKMDHQIDIKCPKFLKHNLKLDKVFQFMGLTAQRKLVNVQVQQLQEKFRHVSQHVNEKCEVRNKLKLQFIVW